METTPENKPQESQDESELFNQRISSPENIELLTNYERPFELSAMMRKYPNDRIINTFLYLNPDIVELTAAALIFTKLIYDKNNPRLRRDGNIVHIYKDEPLFYWLPLVDLTKPSAPFEHIPLLEGEDEFLSLQGADFFSQNDPKKCKHYRRGNTSKISNHFLMFCSKLPNEPGFLTKNKPGKTVSAVNGLICWSDEDQAFQISPHSPNHLQTIPAFTYTYVDHRKIDPPLKATCEKYFNNLSPQDEIDIFSRFLGTIIGYSLTPYRIKKFWILVGGNDSGKTELSELLSELHSATETLKIADFFKISNRPGEFDSEVFNNSLIVINDDFRPGGELPADLFKSISNRNSTIQIKQKYKPSITKINTATILFSCNADPKCKDSYIHNRIIGIPFVNSFEDTEENEHLLKQMHSPEMQEVLFNYGVYCLGLFFRDGLDAITPESVKKKTAEIIGSLNDIQDWLSSCVSDGSIVIAPYSRVKKSDLYAYYIEQRKNHATGRNNFYAEIERNYKSLDSNGLHYFEGLSLNKQENYCD